MKIKELVMLQGLVVGHGVNGVLYGVQVLLGRGVVTHRAWVNGL